MKILVAGGAGFIGSHIVDAYIKKGHKVIVVDSLVCGKKSNLNSKAKFYKVDIRDTKEIERIIKKESPEVINHHAALVSVTASMRDPMGSFETNVTGTINLLEAFGKHGVGKRKFIYASSGGAAYGNAKDIPSKEDSPILPISPYGLTKYMGEEVVTFFAKQRNLNYLIFRYANVYGPRQRAGGEGGVVAVWSDLIKHNHRPTIFGDGTKTRDYVFVGDVAKANMIALNKGAEIILNIGTGIQTTDQEVFDTIKSALAYKNNPHYSPLREGEVMRSALDFSRAKKILGWEPKVSFKKGVGITISQ